MKKFTKLLGIVLIIALVLSMGTMALADDPQPQAVGTATATITAPSNQIHTYEVYQIFAGDLSTDGTTLSNVIWGTNSTGRGTGVKIGDRVAQSVLDGLAGLSGTDAAMLSTIKNYVDLTSDPIGTVTNGASLEVPTGYYLIKDVDDSLDETSEAYTQYIVQVLNNITINPKAEKPSSEKKVQDINDSTGVQAVDSSNSTWIDSADYDIGDEIPYSITATIPADLRWDDFASYALSFVDTMSKGLTYKANSTEVYINDTKIEVTLEPTSASAADTEGAYKGGTIYTWAIENLKADPYSCPKTTTTNQVTTTVETVVRIEYKAVLNADAVVGSAGNPNKMHIEFSNNPNNTDDKGKTPDDTNIVFTYKTVFNKVDGDNKPLTGADFKLEKFIKNANGTDTLTVGTETIKGTWTDVTTLGTTAHPTKVKTGVEAVEGKDAEGDNPAVEAQPAVADCVFTFTGLDDGYYKLTETVTPDGYNTIDPIEFQITATHDIVSDSPTLTALTGTSGAQITMTPNVAAGSLTTDVINQSGTVLPSTGGIGTTIFYVVGSILVVAAGVLLITKKRMGRD